MSELEDRWFWAYPTESVDCDGITGSANEVYSKSDADKVIGEKDQEIAELKVKATKLLGCLKYLVMRDLIKDCPPKKVASEIVKEYDNGLG